VVEIVDSNTFWERMCDRRFVRTSRLSGRIGQSVYVTLQAPEDVEGLIDRHMKAIARILNGEPIHQS
jgi:CelD/BcsL family acetyltransferase involved in cellulose biosynthesis